MALFSGLLRRNSGELHEPSYPNDLPASNAGAEIAATFKRLPELSFRAQPKMLAARPASTPHTKKIRTSQRASSYQLNVRVSGEQRAALRRYARQHRITQTAAIAAAIDLLTAPQ